MITILEISAPVIEYRLLGPLFLTFIAACIGVLIEAFAPRHLRDEAQILVTLAALLGSIGVLISTWGGGWRTIAGMGALAIDGPTQVLWGLILVFGVLSTMLFAERRAYAGSTAFTPMAVATPGSTLERQAQKARVEHTEVFPLLLFAIFGMLLFPASNDLILMFVALEIFSLPLYLLSGMARRRRLLSQEAALKYFLLGALSSAFFLFGVAMLYGYSGSFSLRAVAAATGAPQQSDALLLTGLLMLSVGLLFKIGAVPFHSWTPDVYQGAPTPVTAFMAVCTKIAAIGALMRVLFVALGGVRWTWQPLMAGIAVLTMVVGAVLMIVQRNMKRMLAYSSVAHAGFLLTALVGAATFETGVIDGRVGSASAIGIYMAAYGFATVGAFALLSLVRGTSGEAGELTSWAGLAKQSPWVAMSMTVFMLSLAGIPLTAGFIGKWAVFSAAWFGGYWWLVLIGVIVSLITAAMYLRVIYLMYFAAPPEEAPVVVEPGIGTMLALAVSALATLFIGIAPGPLLDLMTQSSQLLR